MYTENELEISNKSYTNKDFATIYPELLDLVKKLTDKWDPTTSNESDPGVVLLKLAALIADKNNYNIDKNILEAFPLSVTQQSNARKLYDMLGYSMNWYKAADTDVSFTYTGNAFKQSEEVPVPVDTITIPQWTMITDDTTSVIYTLLEDVKLAQALKTETGPAIQGTVHDYDVNGVTDITLDNLDSDLRIYFKEKFIAENGIFITNKGHGSTEFDGFWSKVDNLEREAHGSKVFKFGILPNSDTCYIQFPQDIGNLIENGLNIKYILTQGDGGNIKAHTLTTLYEKLTPEEFQASDNLKNKTINDDITIQNVNSATNGADPETIDSAYANYKRTVGTFDTLVTLRDYENAIYNAKDYLDNSLVSNVVVSDRTCDINNTTNVVQRTATGSLIKSFVALKQSDLYEKVGEDEYQPVMEDSMTAFDIGLYILDAVKNVDTDAMYNKSFSVSNDFEDVELELKQRKCVTHEYIDTLSNANLYLYKAFYRLQGKIITHYKVTLTQAQDIENKVRLALYKRYNSRNVNFGQPINYDDLVKTILNADTRIKTVILAEPEYILKYMNSDDNEGSINSAKSFFDPTHISEGNFLLVDFLAKMILAGNVQLYNFNKDIRFSFGQTGIKRYADVKEISSTATIRLDPEANVPSGATVNACRIPVTVISKNLNIQLIAPNLYVKTAYGAHVNYELIKDSAEQTVTYESGNEFTQEQVDGPYTCTVSYNGSSVQVLLSEESVSSLIQVKIDNSEKELLEYTVADNTVVIHVLDPHLEILVKSHEDSIKLESITSISALFELPKNVYYKLKDDESILLNYTDSNKNVQFKKLDAGKIVRYTDSNDTGPDVLSKTPSTLDKVYQGTVHKMSTLSSTQQIEELAINEVEFKDTNGQPILALDCLWFTNTKEESTDGSSVTYILFNSGESERLLEDNEYFIYTNQQRNELVILGSGTLIRRTTDRLPEVKHTVSVDAASLLANGQAAVENNDWYSFKQTSNGDGVLCLREMLMVTLGQGAGFRCESILLPVDSEEYVLDNTFMPVIGPEYCELYSNTGENVWTSLTTFDIEGLDEYIGWKIRTRLNLMMSNTYELVLSSTADKNSEIFTISFPKISTVKDVKITWKQGDDLWSVPCTLKPDGETYSVNLEGKTWTLDVDSNLAGTLTPSTGAAINIVAGKFKLEDVLRYVQVTTNTLVDNDVIEASLEDVAILTNSIIGSSGGSNMRLDSTTGSNIDLYTYTKAELPSYDEGDITYTIEPNANNELVIDYDFYQSVVSNSLEVIKFKLPFSYIGCVANKSGDVEEYIQRNKKFIVPVTLSGLHSTIDVTVVIGTDLVSKTSKITVDSNTNSDYIQYTQIDDNFLGLSIDSWTIDTEGLASETVTSTPSEITINNETYQLRLDGNKLQVTTSNSRIPKYYAVGAVFKLGSNWLKFEYKDNKYQVVTLNIADTLTIGEIFIIDSIDNQFSPQVNKTLNVLALKYSQPTTKTLQDSLMDKVADSNYNFDTTYIVPEEDMIDTTTTDEANTDYLFSTTAIFDSHHIMNKYLIPQMITDGQSSIKVAAQSITR